MTTDKESAHDVSGFSTNDQEGKPILTTDHSRPYAEAAALYYEKGWTGTLPVPYGRKAPVPVGRTGNDGAYPSRADVQAWTEDRGGDNIVLRMPANVIGVDLDAYDDKQGAQTFAELEAELGKLPPTVRVTSRDDGVSGIRFYTVPEGLRWPGILGPGIETVRREHRYAVAWPSKHPNGGTYRWLDHDGAEFDGVPSVSDLPALPSAWVQHFTHGELASTAEKADLSTSQARAWLAAHDGTGEPCTRVTGAVTDALACFGEGSRHDWALKWSGIIVGAAAEGHHGAGAALDQLSTPFVDALALDRATRADAEAEWWRAVDGAVSIAAGRDTEPESCLTHKLTTAELLDGKQACGSQASAPSANSVAGQSVSIPSAPSGVLLLDADAADMSAVSFLWDRMITFKGLCIVGGVEGAGKSTFGIWLAAQVTRGTLPGDCQGYPKGVIIAGPEDAWREVVVPRLDAAGADFALVKHIPEMGFAADVFDRIDAEVEKWGVDVALVWVDNLVSAIDVNDANSRAQVTGPLRRASAWAERTDRAVVAPTHVNKAAGNFRQALTGTGAFSSVPRSVLGMVNSKADDGSEETLVGTYKANAFPTGAGHYFRQDPRTRTVTLVHRGSGEMREREVTDGRLTYVRPLPDDEDAAECLDRYFQRDKSVSEPAEVKETCRDYVLSQVVRVPGITRTQLHNSCAERWSMGRVSDVVADLQNGGLVWKTTEDRVAHYQPSERAKDWYADREAV